MVSTFLTLFRVALHRSFLTEHLPIGIPRERSSSISAIKVATFKSHTMASADFSQFVVTTANDSACETSPLKVRTLFPHLPATFTGTSGNFGASSLLADSPIFPSLICDSCPSGQGFAYSFLQIPPHDGHPCCSAMCFAVAYAHSGLSPVRARPWRAN